MASSFTFKPLQQTQLQLLSFTHCKYSSSLNPFKFHFSYENLPFSANKTIINQPKLHTHEVCSHATHLETTLYSTDTEHFLSRSTTKHRTNNENSSVSSSISLRDKTVNKNPVEEDINVVVVGNIEKRVILKDRYAKTGLNSRNRRKKGSGSSFVEFKDEKSERNNGTTRELRRNNGKKGKQSKNDDGSEMGVKNMEKGTKKSKVESRGTTLRVGLDMCSKRGDVIGAINLYDLARKEGVKMGQYHYAVLLYLCSSAATGVVQPAKSGSSARSLNRADTGREIPNEGSENLPELGQMGSRNRGTNEISMQVTNNDIDAKESDGKERLTVNNSGDQVIGAKSRKQSVEHQQTLDILVQLMKNSADDSSMRDLGGLQGSCGIQVSEDVKKYALQRGFEIYEKMQLENVPMNEATLTAVARMSMSLGDGDTAFDMVKQMKELGINPRLRSYGPALSVFCNSGDVEKAFLVEEHMLKHGVHPEEPELEALLRVSTDGGRSDKVYYLLHKLRTSVRQVSPSTADEIEKWFTSKVASRVGKRKWDQRLIKKAVENGGGGWHGQGWLGKGRWTVSRTCVGSDGFCKCCGEKLVTIDLDPVETEKFSESVASLAAQREKNSSFQKFQKWLDYYGPFEAVVDGANVGLYSQRRFRPSKVNAVVNGIRQVLPSKKLPLIILHNRRITGDKMDEPVNKKLIEKWKNADALYATPTGSNDDWYWLYAAIKFKCLLITNDEMRDHLFQLLGNDFFPKWKERHQVHFSFSETGPVFRMPPPCSVVIQESEKGHWHLPIKSELESEEERTWLCITRSDSMVEVRDSPHIHGGSNTSRGKKERTKSASQTGIKASATPAEQGDQNDSKRAPQEMYRNIKSILTSSVSDDYITILPELKLAEELGVSLIDFQI